MDYVLRADNSCPEFIRHLMCQALKSLGVETQLVIYPGQFHGLTMPSYQCDRLERHIAWFDKHLKTARQQ